MHVAASAFLFKCPILAYVILSCFKNTVRQKLGFCIHPQAPPGIRAALNLGMSPGLFCSTSGYWCSEQVPLHHICALA